MVNAHADQIAAGFASAVKNLTFKPRAIGSARDAAMALMDLMKFCRQRLSTYKCPRSIDFTDQLPRQDNGKIYKRLLRDRYRAEATPA